MTDLTSAVKHQRRHRERDVNWSDDEATVYSIVLELPFVV